MLQTLPALLEIPENWPLVPVVGKRPYYKKWQEREFERLEILEEIEKGKATGFGLKLGNGFLAIDIDGDSAAKLLAKLAGENSLAEFDRTTAWSSGRSGRKQLLFSVAEDDWGRLRNRKIGTGHYDENGKEEALEFRWIGNQSVLPPSIHPDTGKPYFWLRSPLQIPPLQIPNWLIEICENWHSEYVSTDEIDLVRFPARLFSHFGRQLNIWLLARRFDSSRQKYNGKNKGSGIGSFTLTAAAKILDRSRDHIRKLLCAAKKSGLLRNYHQRGDWITCYYTKFEKVCAIAGIEKLGPIAAVEIDSLANIHIIATEVEAQYLQRASAYRQRQEEIEQIKSQGLDPGKIPSQIVSPTALQTCDYLARVLGRGDRFLYCESAFRFYGGSQVVIADSRGVSPSTVSRHLSNKYRLKPTPVRECRQDMPPIVKKQLLQQLPQLQSMSPKLCAEDGLFWIKDNWWKPHCNIYLLDRRLVSARRRRAQIKAIDKENLLNEKTEATGFDNKFFLTEVNFKEFEKAEQNSKSTEHPPEEGKAKTIVPQQ